MRNASSLIAYSALAILAFCLTTKSVVLASKNEKTEVTVKGTPKGADFDISFTVKSNCHALELVRMYDSKGERIFPHDEAIGAELAKANEEYKRDISVAGRDPFPVWVDFKEHPESPESAGCNPSEAKEKADYHRRGPFNKDGTAAKHDGYQLGKDVDTQINKRQFEAGPGKLRP